MLYVIPVPDEAHSDRDCGPAVIKFMHFSLWWHALLKITSASEQ